MPEEHRSDRFIQLDFFVSFTVDVREGFALENPVAGMQWMS
jgi:hypothetical protein